MATELYQLQISGRAKNDFNSCVLHFKATGAVGGDTLGDGKKCINGFIANILDKWLDCLPESYQVDRFTATRVDPAGSAQARRVLQDGDYPGTYATSFNGNNLCPCVRLIPGMGADYAGRIFMPCAPDGAVVDNSYDDDYVSVINDLLDAMIAGYTNSGVTFALAIYSRKSTTYSLVTAYNLSPAIGFQRRRALPY